LAQNNPGEKETDAKTYELYMQANWDELIEAGNKAIDSEIDFYFLRMRMGIAYYENQNFMSAAEHFKRAYEFSPKEPTVLEYLYWSLIFSGRDKEARALTSNIPQSLITKIGAKPDKLFSDVYTEGGLTYNADYNNQKKSNFGNDTLIYGDKKLDKYLQYISFNIILTPLKRLTIFQGYNNINITSTKKFVSIGNSSSDFEISTKQNEYYLNAGYYAGSGFTLSGILHYLNVKVDDITANVNTQNGNITYSNMTTTLNNYVGLLSIEKSLNHFKFILGNSYSNLNNAKQIQNGLTIVYFPFGNLNLYSVTDLTLHSEKKDKGAGRTSEAFMSRGLIKQEIGFKVIDKLWLEGFYFFGNGVNFHEDNAYVVFNSINTIKNRFGFNLLSSVSSNIQLSLRYQYYNQEVSELIYETSSSYKFLQKTNSFHKIIGSIKWTF
jgi:tetratricopeptide (TPR) repeat protein